MHSQDPIYFAPQRKLGGGWICWKDSPSPPPAPDYKGAAEATAAGNIQAAQTATTANRVNQYSPYGSSTYIPPSDPSGAWSQYINLSPTGESLLNAGNQSALGIAGLQQGATGAVANSMGTPFDSSGYPGVQTSVNQPSLNYSVNPYGVQSSIATPNIQGSLDTSGVSGIPQADAQARQNAEDAAFSAAKSRLDPQWDTRSTQSDTQLRNQGIMPGTEAYSNYKRDENNARNDAYSQAQAEAVQQGLAAQQAQFGMGLAANQTGYNQALGAGNFANQAAGQQFGMGATNAGLYNSAAGQLFGQDLQAATFGNQAAGQDFSQGLQAAQFGNMASNTALEQALALRNQPLQELNALRTGSQVTNPQFSMAPQQQTTAGPNYFGAAGQQGQYDQNIYNQQVGSQNALTSALGQMAGTAGMFMFGSDMRIKENIVFAGVLNGHNVYEFDYKPEYRDTWGHGRKLGVMAQEVIGVVPNAVTMHPDGYLMVDYGRL